MAEKLNQASIGDRITYIRSSLRTTRICQRNRH